MTSTSDQAVTFAELTETECLQLENFALKHQVLEQQKKVLQAYQKLFEQQLRQRLGAQERPLEIDLASKRAFLLAEAPGNKTNSEAQEEQRA